MIGVAPKVRREVEADILAPSGWIRAIVGVLESENQSLLNGVVVP